MTASHILLIREANMVAYGGECLVAHKVTRPCKSSTRRASRVSFAGHFTLFVPTTVSGACSYTSSEVFGTAAGII